MENITQKYLIVLDQDVPEKKKNVPNPGRLITGDVCSDHVVKEVFASLSTVKSLCLTFPFRNGRFYFLSTLTE